MQGEVDPYLWSYQTFIPGTTSHKMHKWVGVGERREAVFVKSKATERGME